MYKPDPMRVMKYLSNERDRIRHDRENVFHHTSFIVISDLYVSTYDTS